MFTDEITPKLIRAALMEEDFINVCVRVSVCIDVSELLVQSDVCCRKFSLLYKVSVMPSNNPLIYTHQQSSMGRTNPYTVAAVCFYSPNSTIIHTVHDAPGLCLAGCVFACLTVWPVSMLANLASYPHLTYTLQFISNVRFNYTINGPRKGFEEFSLFGR